MNRLLIFLLLSTHLCLFCEEDPLPVYLTWTEDPTTTMVVEWVSSIEEGGSVRYKEEKEEKEWHLSSAISIPFPDQQPHYAHRAYLKNLTPNTPYEFSVLPEENVYRFKTMPEKLSSPLMFIVGGDVNLSDPAVFDQTTSAAASYDPSFIVIGGDFSCAASINPSKPEHCDRWLTWIRHWSLSSRTKEGRLIPLLCTLGNHDVRGFFGQTSDHASYFHCLFASPGPRGYTVLHFDHYLSLYLLDSGHTNSPGGDQETFLAEELKKDDSVLHKIAVYHVPAYPNIRPYRNSYSSAIRRHFVPVFDKYHLDVAFEHHDHAYKRTFPLTDGRPDPLGVLYIGNGSWGVRSRVPQKKPSRTMYLEKSIQARGFCRVFLSRNDRSIIATTYDGAVIDQVFQPTTLARNQERLRQELQSIPQ